MPHNTYEGAKIRPIEDILAAVPITSLYSANFILLNYEFYLREHTIHMTLSPNKCTDLNTNTLCLKKKK